MTPLCCLTPNSYPKRGNGFPRRRTARVSLYELPSYRCLLIIGARERSCAIRARTWFVCCPIRKPVLAGKSAVDAMDAAVCIWRKLLRCFSFMRSRGILILGRIDETLRLKPSQRLKGNLLPQMNWFRLSSRPSTGSRNSPVCSDLLQSSTIPASRLCWLIRTKTTGWPA